MDGALLRDCGWDSTNPENAGPYLQAADARIRDSTVDFNPVALILDGASNVSIEGSSLRGMERGLDLNRSSVRMSNSTLTSVGVRPAYLDSASLLECLNSTMPRTGLQFIDAESRLNISWYLDVAAVWPDGSPVPGAMVTVRDKNNDTIYSNFTGDDGRIPRAVLVEACLTRDATVVCTPHTVNCSMGRVWNETQAGMYGSRSLELVLVDTQGPELCITSPAPDSYVNSSSVVVAGQARDSFGLALVEVVADGFLRRTLFGSAAGEDRLELDWNTTFELSDGFHSIEALATDLGGNTAFARVALEVDTVSPRVRIASPQNGTLTNLSLVAVRGYMEPGARVFVRGAGARTDRDTFIADAVLTEGENRLTAVAVDAAGNVNSSTVTVRLDSLPPRLEVAAPADGLRTRTPILEVAGTVEPGAFVYVNGRLLAAGTEPGTFRTAIALTKETTRVIVEAEDRAGNRNVTVRNVALDTSPPFLRLSSPGDGLLTNTTGVTLGGTTEAGATLVVGNTTLQLPDEGAPEALFSLPLTLKEGPNTIVVLVRDAAGNQNFATVHVTVDTVAPALVLLSPENGTRTANATVYVLGRTEPGAGLTIDGNPVAVGRAGDFSLELRLATGANRIVVRAEDDAGNGVESVLTVGRVAAGPADVLVTGALGPDWPFVAFLLLSFTGAAAEGYGVRRHFGGRRAGAPGRGV